MKKKRGITGAFHSWGGEETHDERLKHDANLEKRRPVRAKLEGKT